MVSEARLLRNWLAEVGRRDPLWIDDFAITTNGRLSKDNEHRIRFTGHRVRTDIVFAQFVGKRHELEQGAAVLLNGDGFSETYNGRMLTGLQTRIRGRAVREFTTRHVAVIPFQALTASGINYATIRVLHLTGERNWTEIQPISIPDEILQEPRPRGQDITRTVEGIAYRISRINGWSAANNQRLRVMRDNAWVQVYISARNGSTIRTRRHRLGATLFTAVGPDRRRHRYLSAFDENEVAMYYLAQLPDTSKASTYDQAIYDLAPQIVHDARRNEISVYRQGDVFAIATTLTDAEVLADGATATLSYTPFGQEPEPFPSWRRKKNLMIFDTAHSATEVVKKKDGTTFIRGVLYHAPFFERRGRRPEHRQVHLRDARWFLCARNTVPPL